MLVVEPRDIERATTGEDESAVAGEGLQYF
jgi:hypothetical protein